MKKTIIFTFMILLCFVMVNDARADFFDKLGSFVDEVNEKVNDLDLEKLEKDIDKYAGDITKNSDKAKKALEKYAKKDDDGFLSKTAKSITKGIEKIDETSRDLSKTYKNNSGRISETVGQVKGLGGRIPTTVRTPGIVADESVTISNRTVIADVPITTEKPGIMDRIKGSVGQTINGISDKLKNTGIEIGEKVNKGIDSVTKDNIYTPELINGAPIGTNNKYSMKALEAMAALGDEWSKLKMEEINAKRFMENEKEGYEDTSWFNIFNKVDKLIDYRNSKKFYEDADDKIRDFERNNPGSDGVVSGIDQINDSVLEFKALFGNEKAKAQLQYNKARKELEDMEYKYRKAGFFKKFGLKEDLNFAKKQFERAENELSASDGSRNSSSSSVKQMDSESDGGGILDIFKKKTQKNSSAYQRYIKYLNQPNPDMNELKRLKSLID